MDSHIFKNLKIKILFVSFIGLSVLLFLFWYTNTYIYKSKAANPEITIALSAADVVNVGDEFKVLLEIHGKATGLEFYISYDPEVMAYFKDWDTDPTHTGVTALDVGADKAFFTTQPIIEAVQTENGKRKLHLGLVSTSSNLSPTTHHITLTFKAIKATDMTNIEIDTTKPFEFVGEAEGGTPVQFDLSSSSDLTTQIGTTSISSTPAPTTTPTPTVDPNLTLTSTPTPTPPLEQFSVKSQDITSSTPSKTLYYPLVVRNWPSGNAGSSQWSHIILSNPSAETANATLTVWGAATYDTIQAGAKLKEYSIAIPPHGTYSSYSDNNWKNLPDTYSQEGDQTIGALSIDSNVPISGINRWQMRKGNTFDGMPEQVFDTPLIANPSFSLHSPLVVRNWPSGKEGYTQWSDIMLFNPNADAIDVAFSVFHETEGKNGLPLKEFSKTIPGHGWLNTYGMDEWINLEATGAETKAAVSITGPISKPFVGINRWKLVQGKDTHSNATISTIDTLLLSLENKLFYPLALRNWPSGAAGLTQWTDLTLYNPNNDAVSVQIKIKENNPKSSGSIGSISIPPHGYYATNGKDWLALPRQINESDSTNANVSINVNGIYGIVGIARWRLVAGDTVTGTLQSLSDTPLMGESKGNEAAFPLIARGIPTGMDGLNLWNDTAIFNPSDSPNIVVFKLYSSREGNIFKNGSTLRVFEYIIPPHDYLNTYGLGQWHALPTNNTDPVFSQSSLVIESENPVYAIERMRYLDTSPSNNCQKKPLGDADCNNEIEPTDYEEWGAEFGLTTKETIADFNNNGTISLDDFEIWRSNL